MTDKRLPPMPASDETSLERNSYNSYYKIKSGEFWGENEITRIEEEPFVQCEHEFKATLNGVQCSKCHFGLQGLLEVKKGKLYFKGKKLPL